MKLNSESIYFNPAAASFQTSKFDISAGFTGIVAKVEYRPLPTKDNGYLGSPVEKSRNKLSTPLHVYFNYKPIERLSVGVGFFTPNGSSMRWTTTGRGPPDSGDQPSGFLRAAYRVVQNLRGGSP